MSASSLSPEPVLVLLASSGDGGETGLANFLRALSGVFGVLGFARNGGGTEGAATVMTGGAGSVVLFARLLLLLLLLLLVPRADLTGDCSLSLTGSCRVVLTVVAVAIEVSRSTTASMETIETGLLSLRLPRRLLLALFTLLFVLLFVLLLVLLFTLLLPLLLLLLILSRRHTRSTTARRQSLTSLHRCWVVSSE